MQGIKYLSHILLCCLRQQQVSLYQNHRSHYYKLRESAPWQTSLRMPRFCKLLFSFFYFCLSDIKIRPKTKKRPAGQDEKRAKNAYFWLSPQVPKRLISKTSVWQAFRLRGGCSPLRQWLLRRICTALSLL